MTALNSPARAGLSGVVDMPSSRSEEISRSSVDLAWLNGISDYESHGRNQNPSPLGQSTRGSSECCVGHTSTWRQTARQFNVGAAGCEQREYSSKDWSYEGASRAGLPLSSRGWAIHCLNRWKRNAAGRNCPCSVRQALAR